MTLEELLGLKPGSKLKIIGGANWSEDAKFMLGSVNTLRALHNNSQATFEEQDSWIDKYKKTPFNPEWLEIVEAIWKHKPLSLPEGECPECHRWKTHSLACPEMGLV